MIHKKLYRAFAGLFLIFLVSVIFWQGGYLIKEQRKEQEVWTLTAENPSGPVTGETLSVMEELPGLQSIWTAVQAEAKVTIGDYSGNIKILGVDTASFPMEVVQSCGKKPLGSRPLLIVGEDVFESLTDRNGEQISKRQRQILMENIADAQAEIGAASSHTEGKETIQDTTEILGIIKGDAVYMDQEQMIGWLMKKGESPGITKLYMKIRGRKNTEQAADSLEKAGFVTDTGQEAYR